MDRSRSLHTVDRDFDAAMDLALHLAALHEAHALDEIVVADTDGTPLSSAGDPDAARALAAFAAAVLKNAPLGHARTFHCGKVHVELVSLCGRTCALAAKASFLVLEPESIAASLTAAFATPSPPEVEVIDGGDMDFEFGWEVPTERAGIVAA